MFQFKERDLFVFRTQDKIISWEEAQRLCVMWRMKDEQVVFTNGCFDILHLGHVQILESAAHLGDKLIVGINSDASVKRLKGAERPIFSEAVRARMVAALEFVDVVVLFSEDTPLELIKTLSPDILVKGADYKKEDVVGKEWVEAHGGSVMLLPLLEGFSTTSIIERIKKA